MPQRLIQIPLQQLRAVFEELRLALGNAPQGRGGPPATRSAALLGQAVLDRTFTVMTSAFSGAPEPEQLERALRDARCACELFEARGWLEDPAAYHLEPPPLDGDAGKTQPSWTWDGPRRRRFAHLRFESGFSPHPDQPGREAWLAHPRNGTGHAYVLEHPEPRPWLVCLHAFATGGPFVSFKSFRVAQLHEELGLNLVFPVLPLHGPRSTSRLSGREVLDPDYMRMVHLFAQAVWDVRRVTSWVRARTGTPVGLYGISLGAYVASLVASLCDGYECVIAGLPAADFAGLARDNQPWYLRRHEREVGLDWQVVRNLTHPVSPLALQPRVPHERRFIYAGLADRVARPDQPEALWRHWQQPEIRWLPSGHVLGFRNAAVGPYVADCLRSASLVGASA